MSLCSNFNFNSNKGTKKKKKFQNIFDQEINFTLKCSSQ